MKKVVLIIGLVIVLVGSIFGGAFYVNAGSGPTLQAWWSDPGGIVTVVGTGWVPAVAVNLWMDKQDDAHAVNVTIAQSTGNLRTTFNAGPTYLGPHKITAVQNGGSPVSASFTITSVQQVDDRTYNALGDIVNNPDYGLKETKTEVKDIQTDIGTVKTDVAAIKSNLVKMESGSGTLVVNQPGTHIIFAPQTTGTVHVSLTTNVTITGSSCTTELTLFFAKADGTTTGLAEQLGQDIQTIEFDSTTRPADGDVGHPYAWAISIWQIGSGTSELYYNYTMTYPQP